MTDEFLAQEQLMNQALDNLPNQLCKVFISNGYCHPKSLDFE